MTPKKATRRKTPACFVISPIGKDGSSDRQHADLVLNKIIKPALTTLEIRAKRADSISAPDIFSLVVEQLAEAPWAIAVLTNFNPNVMFEVGVRMAWGLPVVLMLEGDDTPLPFDVKSRYTVFYNLDEPKAAITQLRAFLRSIAVQDHPTPDDSGELGSAFRRLAGHYCLDSAIKAKVRLLQAMTDRIEDEVISDLKADYEKGGSNKNALACFADRIEKEFGRLSDYTAVFHKIAEHGETHHISVSQCEPALNAMRDLQRPATLLVRWLRKSDSSPESFKQALTKILKLANGIKAIVKDLHGRN